jgi:uncharacterized membrane protein
MAGKASMTSKTGERTITDTFVQTGVDLKAFVRTRVEILITEVSEKGHVFKLVVALAGVSLVFLLTGYALFIVALVATVANLLRSTSLAWIFSCLIVAFLTSTLGVAAGYWARRSLLLRGFVPTKTLAVLKEDKRWLQAEMKN